MISIVALLLGSGFGCAISTIDEPEFRVVHPGKQAATISRAWAVSLHDKMRLYERERADLEHRRDALLHDATAYRDMSAAVWSEPGIPEYQRGPTASQYSESAEQAGDAADRVQERIDSYTCEIGFLEGQRRDRLLQAAKYDNMTDQIW